MKLSQQEAFARIRLLRSPNIGPVSYRQLLQRFDNARAALEALPELAKRGGRYMLADEKRVSEEIAAVRKAGARYLFHDSPDYPSLLRHTGDAPPILIVRGNSQLTSMPTVAVVGARNASAAAIKLSRDFALALAERGVVIVSGLARGIDGAAHCGALAASGGGTIGVIASGIEIAYPPEHADLQDEVAERGLLIAEQPPGTEPLARHFPSRNRIIAGVAAGTLVVEAAPKSGSLITARLAGEYGREVMAIPGSPLDSRSHGCNQLIRDGAVLVQSPDDVLELLAGFGSMPPPNLYADCETEPTRQEPATDASSGDVVQLLTTAPISVDELIRQSGQSAAEVQLALLELEISGGLVRHAGGRVSIAE